MTILQTYRWKCDYCGAVSPEMERDEMRRPSGWVAGSYSSKKHFGKTKLMHFCRVGHEMDWLAEDASRFVMERFEPKNADVRLLE